MTPAELIELRTRAGMTQQQLADSLGLVRRTIYRYEQGDVKIKYAQEIALRQVLAARSSRVAVPAKKVKKSAK